MVLSEVLRTPSAAPPAGAGDGDVLGAAPPYGVLLPGLLLGLAADGLQAASAIAAAAARGGKASTAARRRCCGRRRRLDVCMSGPSWSAGNGEVPGATASGAAMASSRLGRASVSGRHTVRANRGGPQSSPGRRTV